MTMRNGVISAWKAFPATPGSKWQLQAYSLMTCQENPISEINDNFVTEKLVFKDASSVEIATAEAVIVNGFSPLGTWTNHSIATTAPVNTATVEAYILFNSPSLLSGAAWIDDVQLQTGPAVVAVAPTAGQFKLELSRILPNPFRAGVRIDFSVPRGDDADLSVFDMSGRRVAQVLHAHLAAGSHSVSWDGRNSSGAAAAGGIYRCVLRTSTGTVSRNMVRVK